MYSYSWLNKINWIVAQFNNVNDTIYPKIFKHDVYVFVANESSNQLSTIDDCIKCLAKYNLDWEFQLWTIN